MIEGRLKEICDKAQHISNWVDTHDAASAVLIRDAADIHNIVEGKRAFASAHKFLAWIIGAIVSGLMFWQTWRDFHP